MNARREEKTSSGEREDDVQKWEWLGMNARPMNSWTNRVGH
jgi:hypothetical protein